MAGFSLGAHIAALTCRYLYKSKEVKELERISFLLGKSWWLHTADSLVKMLSTSMEIER